jgi:acetolactate decarboxylase
MPRLDTTISAGLWQALMTRAEQAHEPPSHIVSQALAEYLAVTHHTLYQVSTATALVEGVYQGAVRVGTLREHGDLGLGTFENLDGEMVVVDGRFFQVRSDGSVRECGNDVLSPFAVVTRFAPEREVWGCRGGSPRAWRAPARRWFRSPATAASSFRPTSWRRRYA